MIKEEVFTSVDLPVFGKCNILEGKGIHYFSALIKSKGENSQIVKFLMLELVLINGKNVTEDQLNEMNMRDIFYISQVIEAMLIKLPEGL